MKKVLLAIAIVSVTFAACNSDSNSDAPKTDSPKVENTPAETPKTDSPKVEANPADTSKVDNTEVDNPKKEEAPSAEKEAKK